MKKLIIIGSIILISCGQKHSKEYYDAMDNYNKAHQERLKADSAYNQAVKEYQLNK